MQHRAETEAVVGEHTRQFSTDELDERLAAAGIPAARLNGMRELVGHPQLAARNRWREVQTEAGSVDAVLPPMTFRDVDMRMGRIPALGEHTDALLAELGNTTEQINRLRAEGIVG